MKFKHNPCGHIFNMTFSNFKSGHGCPLCGAMKIESTHASVLKQVFLHECPDTVIEEQSCVNPNTNAIMPTDIVNHRLKIAIEVQSAYHDVPYKQKTDKIKKDFWVSKGYQFYDPDIRNYSVLEMVQLFFPNIKERPNYILYDFGHKLDIVKCQQLLDEKISVEDISVQMNKSVACIRSAIRDKRLSYPDNYNDNIIYCFNLKMEYIDQFDSIFEAYKKLEYQDLE